ncbi:MAG: hypothetical protein GC151_06125 [Betaproteobacteria bacterium]|nr:hypothetical protein [Betaproteobacteria bacterium]
MISENALSTPWLVVGPPRGGFTLLLSILTLLQRDAGWIKPDFQEVADSLIAFAGEAFDATLRKFFRERVGDDRLFYSREFSTLIGGPKWLSADDPDTACVRKYLGVKGIGDFTFVLYVPSWTLSFDSIVHSHSHPDRWPVLPAYRHFRRFASIRHPVDIVHSSVFSINALASEYIRRELNVDEHYIRRELALNKLTKPEVVDGLIAFICKYLDQFAGAAQHYLHVMRWEDLIDEPVREISRIADAAGIPATPAAAERIWQEIEHRNLTRHHRHSFRRGRLDDWKNTITNSHLRRFRDAGIDAHLARHGYAPISFLDESSYTPDQILIEERLAEGRPYVEHLDRDLIRFAFNKTNLVAGASFGFEHHDRIGAIEIERSSMLGSTLASDFQRHVADLSETVSLFLRDLRPAAVAAAAGRFDLLDGLVRDYGRRLPATDAGDLRSAVDAVKSGTYRKDVPLPQLVASESGFNIVRLDRRYVCVPQALGPMDLTGVAVESLPAGVIVTDSLESAFRAVATAVSG